MIDISTYKTHLTIAAIIWVVSLALCILAYMFVLRPQNNSKKRLENNLAEQKQIYTSARRAAQEKTRIQLAEQTENLRDRVKSFVLDLEESTDLTFDISQMAGRENLTSLSVMTRAKRNVNRRGIVAGTEPSMNYVSEDHIEIKFNAGFRQFAAFINALERHQPILFVDEFKITRSNLNDLTFQVTLDVAALIRKQQNNETPNAASTSTLSAKI